jgi:hypothetical protein
MVLFIMKIAHTDPGFSSSEGIIRSADVETKMTATPLRFSLERCSEAKVHKYPRVSDYYTLGLSELLQIVTIYGYTTN